MLTIFLLWFTVITSPPLEIHHCCWPMSPDDQSVVCIVIITPSPAGLAWCLESGETRDREKTSWVECVAHCTLSVSPDHVSEVREPLTMLPGEREQVCCVLPWSSGWLCHMFSVSETVNNTIINLHPLGRGVMPLSDSLQTHCPGFQRWCGHCEWLLDNVETLTDHGPDPAQEETSQPGLLPHHHFHRLHHGHWPPVLHKQGHTKNIDRWETQDKYVVLGSLILSFMYIDYQIQIYKF